jgi:hypothetical protein
MRDHQHHRDYIRQYRLLLAITAAMGSICNAAAQQAQQFECGFIYEKMEGGKSGAAACSYSGEKVFSLPGSPPFSSNEHCKTETNGGYEDLVNFRVDLTTNKVVWDNQSGLSPFYVPHMAEYLMQKEKLSKEAAAEKAAKLGGGGSHHYDFNILHTDKIFDIAYVDEISKKQLTEPVRTLAYLITFRNDTSNYSLYISGKRGDAILSEYVSGDEDASWVNLRFGKCRKLTAPPQ